MKKTVTKIPSKQTLNLVVKEKTLASPTRLIPILLLIALGAYAFAQFAVVNRLNQVKQAEAELLQMRNQLEMIQNSYADYEEIQKEYNRYTYQNFDRTIPDRLDVLAMIERQLFPIGTVKNISISGRIISLTLEGPNLEEVSSLYAALYSEPLIEDVTISSYNGSGDRSQNGEGTTTITMTISLIDATTLGNENKADADGDDVAENGNPGTENGGQE